MLCIYAVFYGLTQWIEADRDFRAMSTLINVADSPLGRTDPGSGAVHLLPGDWMDPNRRLY